MFFVFWYSSFTLIKIKRQKRKSKRETEGGKNLDWASVSEMSLRTDW